MKSIFSKIIAREIPAKIIAEKNSRQRLIAEMYRISNLTTVRQILCDLHRSQSKELENCNVCFDEGLIAIKTD